MNEFERRTLIGAAGLGAIAALSKAGPLNPPAGAVAPTGRTLDEVYNKIPTLPGGGSGDGRIPIPGSGQFTVMVAQPGSYVLTGNITVAGIALSILTSNVTVDLNGYTVTSTSPLAGAVTIDTGHGGVTVRNGQVVGGLIGVAASGVKNVLLEDLVIVNARTLGVSLVNNCRNTTIRRCQVCDTGLTSTASDVAPLVAGIQYQGYGGVIQDCTVHRLFSNVPGGSTFRGITLPTNGQTGNVIEGCRVVHETPAISGAGIHINSGIALYRNNSVLNFTSAYSITGGTNVNGGGNV